MADVKYKPIGKLILVVLISFLFGIIGSIGYLFQLIQKGPRRMFYKKKRNERPEVLWNNALGNHEFIMLKNSRMKLHCVINGPKDKPLMLFLHGFPEFWYSWRHQLKEFCKDYRVCAIDMRGYGDSDKPSRITDYHMTSLTDDVIQLVTQLGCTKCVLVAHDWGGTVAWYFALRYPDVVDKLIVCNAPHPAAFELHHMSSVKEIFVQWYLYFAQLPVLPVLQFLSDDLYLIEEAFTLPPLGAKPGTFTEEDLEAYKYTLSEYNDLWYTMNYDRCYMRCAVPDWAEHMTTRKLEVPTLLIWGDKDAVLDNKSAELSALFVEDFTLKWIEGASHWVQQEEPIAVNQHIREFLAKHR